MESTYRTWIHATKDSSSMWNPIELRRDLLTTLGTAKWQVNLTIMYVVCVCLTYLIIVMRIWFDFIFGGKCS
jgi:hypothetical protein